MRDQKRQGDGARGNQGGDRAASRPAVEQFAEVAIFRLTDREAACGLAQFVRPAGILFQFDRASERVVESGEMVLDAEGQCDFVVQGGKLANDAANCKRAADEQADQDNGADEGRQMNGVVKRAEEDYR